MNKVTTTTTSTPTANERDAEMRALWANPAFRTLLERSRRSAAEQGTISLDELDRRRPPTEAAKAHAAAYLEALDRLEEEQDAEVTDDQGRVLHLVLTAAAYARGQGALAQLAEDSGCPEAEIRAAAAALQILGLDDARSQHLASPITPHAAQLKPQNGQKRKVNPTAREAKATHSAPGRQ